MGLFKSRLNGLLYSKAELESLRCICDKYKMKLYCDGARLGYALACKECDVTLEDLSNLCDAFYIGGTKVGALFGEAVVFTKNNTPSHFISRIKQHGALLAKGFITGVQFDTLFTDDLYIRISEHAIHCANTIRRAFKDKGYSLYLDSHTNQVFVILNSEQYERLSKIASFSYWDNYDEDKTIVRFATSWATKFEDVLELVSHI